MATPVTLSDWFKSRETDLRKLAPEVGRVVSAMTASPAWDTVLQAYVLGVAGVGKSSLINTLLSDRLMVLPHGGFGPQTACPTHIRYSSEPFMTISYVPRDRVDHLVRSLAAGNDAHALQSAALLVEGTQFGATSREYLAASLAHACRGQLSPGARERDRGRLSELARLLAPDGPRTVSRLAGSDLHALLLDLETHAAGFLSPLVSEVTIGWDAPFLEPGIELVDLPGVGIANDSYRRSTSESLHGATCVLLVVDRAGLTRDVADVVSPFFAEWIARGPAAQRLIVSVVKLDLVVGERRSSEGRAKRRTWLAHFDSVATDVVGLVRAQLRAELRRLFRHVDDVRIDEIVEQVLVRPVAPLEHLRLHRRDPEDAPHIERADDSRVFALRSTLREIADEHRANVRWHLDEVLRAREREDCERAAWITELREELARAS